MKINRLARSLKDLIFLLEEIAAKEAVLKLGASSFDFSSAEGRLTENLLGSVAQFERELISERTKLGLKAAKEMGRFGGRHKGMTDEAKLLAKDAYEMRIKDYLISEILQLTGIISKQTLYKYIRYHIQILSKKTGRKIAESGLELR